MRIRYIRENLWEEGSVRLYRKYFQAGTECPPVSTCFHAERQYLYAPQTTGTAVGKIKLYSPYTQWIVLSSLCPSESFSTSSPYERTSTLSASVNAHKPSSKAKHNETQRGVDYMFSESVSTVVCGQTISDPSLWDKNIFRHENDPKIFLDLKIRLVDCNLR